LTNATRREHRLIVMARRRSLVPVDQPLVMITQMPRSGGTLLARLFDGHPACHVFARELRSIFISDSKATGGAEKAWAALDDPSLDRILKVGHTQGMQRLHGDRSAYPLLIPPVVLKELFFELYRERKPATGRAVLDVYMTAYFNAWLDNANLRPAEDKRWVVGFSPHTVARRRKCARFEELYPDGRVISIIRDPWSWFASAQRWSRRWTERDAAIEAWAEAVRAARDWHARAPERVRIVGFDRLVGAPEATMRELAGWLGVEPRPELLRPTINGVPAAANSSFPAPGQAVSTDPVQRRRAELGDEDAAAIDAAVGELYAEVEALGRQ